MYQMSSYTMSSYTHDDVVKAVKRFAELGSTPFGTDLREMIASGEAEVVGIVDGEFAFRMVPKAGE